MDTLNLYQAITMWEFLYNGPVVGNDLLGHGSGHWISGLPAHAIYLSTTNILWSLVNNTNTLLSAGNIKGAIAGVLDKTLHSSQLRNS